MPKPPKPISEENKAELPTTQREGGSHVTEGKGDFKPPKPGPCDRQSRSQQSR